MSGAMRSAKMKRYTVTVQRSYEVNTQMEIEARSAEEAEGLVDVLLEVEPERLKPFIQCFAGSTKAKVKRA